MKKSNKTVKLVLYVVLVAILAVLVFSGFKLSKIAGVYDIKSFLSEVNYGSQITDATQFKLTVAEGTENTDVDLKQIKTIISKRLASWGLSDYGVSIKDNAIVVKASGIDDVASLTDMLTRKGLVTILDSKDAVALDGTMISTASTSKYYQSDSSILPAVVIKFNEEGTALLKTLTQNNFYSTITLKVDDETVSTPTVSSVIEDGQMYLAIVQTETAAKRLAGLVNAGPLSVDLECETSEVTGSAAKNIVLYSLIGLSILALVIFFVLGKKTGLVSFLSVLFFIEAYVIVLLATELSVNTIEIAVVIASVLGFIAILTAYHMNAVKNAKGGVVGPAAYSFANKNLAKAINIVFAAVLLIGALLFCLQIKALANTCYILMITAVLGYVIYKLNNSMISNVM